MAAAQQEVDHKRRERKRERQRERRRITRARRNAQATAYSSEESDVDDCATPAEYTCDNDEPPPDHVVADMEATEYPQQPMQEDSSHADAMQNSSDDDDTPDTAGDQDGQEDSDSSSADTRGPNSVAGHRSLRGYNAATMLTPEEELATLVAEVKARSYVSDAAIEKLWNLCSNRADTIQRLVRVGRLPKTYRKGIRKIAMKGLPRVHCTAVVEDKTDNTFVRKKFRFGESLPKALLDLPPDSNRTLLRTEAAVMLRDIKKYHIWVHQKLGFDDAAIEQQLKECDVSIYGVQDTKKGKRTFIAVSVRISRCLYLWRVYHPLVGVKGSKPNIHQILR